MSIAMRVLKRYQVGQVVGENKEALGSVLGLEVVCGELMGSEMDRGFDRS
jgi:hypothetical protein